MSDRRVVLKMVMSLDGVPPAPSAASDGPIATAMNEKPKAVFSRTLEKAEWVHER
jgi:hypothetical protein